MSGLAAGPAKILTKTAACNNSKHKPARAGNFTCHILILQSGRTQCSRIDNKRTQNNISKDSAVLGVFTKNSALSKHPALLYYRFQTQFNRYNCRNSSTYISLMQETGQTQKDRGFSPRSCLFMQKTGLFTCQNACPRLK